MRIAAKWLVPRRQGCMPMVIKGDGAMDIVVGENTRLALLAFRVERSDELPKGESCYPYRVVLLRPVRRCCMVPAGNFLCRPHHCGKLPFGTAILLTACLSGGGRGKKREEVGGDDCKRDERSSIIIIIKPSLLTST